MDLLLDKKFAEQPVARRIEKVDVEEQKKRNAASIALMMQSIADNQENFQRYLNDPEFAKEADQEDIEFKRNLDAPRKQAGARLLFPELDTENDVNE